MKFFFERTFAIHFRAAIAVAFMVIGSGIARAESLVIHNHVTSTTPARLGYNLGHFMPASNAADWFRYSGAGAARVFMSVAVIEPTDDIAPVGDGVESQAGFFARRSLLRSNGASTTEALDDSLVDWASFKNHYYDISTGSNRIVMDHALGNLRDRGIPVLANLTASPSRFPISGENDWAGKWELWQHYYAEAFLLTRDYSVDSFGMFNEPNGYAGMTEVDWLMRYRICSDAIQTGVADMNARYGKSVIARVFAANTANGAEKYNSIGPDSASTDTWGHDAVANRHLMLDGSSSPAWMNLQIYNYQKYTHRPYAEGGFSGFISDYDTLRASIDADTPGEPQLPMALTEFNVRTGATYDSRTETQDSPFDFSALGANCVALTSRGVRELYLFKFGQTASNSIYGVAKNGTHYVENDVDSGFNYGGATKSAEVYRLFCAAASDGRPSLQVTASAGASPTVTGGVWCLATHDTERGVYQVFIANKQTSAVPLEVDFSQLPVAAGNPVRVEEVSGLASGGIVRNTDLAGGKLGLSDMPSQSVWLITVPESAMFRIYREASADTMLGDGASKDSPGGVVDPLVVRADGTADGRKVALIRIPRPAGDIAEVSSYQLEMDMATTAGSSPVAVQVYGITGQDWSEDTATWATSNAFLKQDVVDGIRIRNNIVNGQGNTTFLLGQLVVNSTQPATRALDVTQFVKSLPDGIASFLIVQNHRWDIALPSLSTGDTQPAGVIVSSRESIQGGPRLLAITPTPAATPWSVWQQSRFGDDWQDMALAGTGADPDHDGVFNLLEYALAGDPLIPDTGSLPVLERSAGLSELHFSRDVSASDLRLVIESTTDLSTPWQEMATSEHGNPFVALDAEVTVSESGGSIRDVIFRDQRVAQPLARFFRLKAHLDP